MVPQHCATFGPVRRSVQDMKQQPRYTPRNPTARLAWRIAELVEELPAVLKTAYQDRLESSFRFARVQKFATMIYVKVGPVIDYLERRFGLEKSLVMAQRLNRLFVRHQHCTRLDIPEFEEQVRVDASKPSNAFVAASLLVEAKRCAQYIKGWAQDIDEDELKRSAAVIDPEEDWHTVTEAAELLAKDLNIPLKLAKARISAACTRGEIKTNGKKRGDRRIEPGSLALYRMRKRDADLDEED